MKLKALKSQISRKFTEMGQFYGRRPISQKMWNCELGCSLSIPSRHNVPIWLSMYARMCVSTCVCVCVCVSVCLGSVGSRPECSPDSLCCDTPGWRVRSRHDIMSTASACSAVAHSAAVCRPGNQHSAQTPVRLSSVPLVMPMTYIPESGTRFWYQNLVCMSCNLVPVIFCYHILVPDRTCSIQR